MRRFALFGSGVLTGLLIAVAGFVFLALSDSGKPAKAQVEFTTQLIEREQNRLGATCNESLSVVKTYLSSLEPMLTQLRNHERISLPSSVIQQGDRTYEVVSTCARLRNMAVAVQLTPPAPEAVADDNFRASLSVVTLSVLRAAASWCEEDCRKDASQKIGDAIVVLNKAVQAGR